MNKITVVISLSTLFFIKSFSQNLSNEKDIYTRKCGSPKVDSLYEEKFQNMMLKHQQFANDKKASVVYNIPVIFHVVHSGYPIGSGANLSQAQINSQLTVLNADYRKLNSDLSTWVTQSSFSSVAADVEINFCAAKVSPEGTNLSEPGIDRIDALTKGWTGLYTRAYIESTIKPGSFWDPAKYYNVWILTMGGVDAGVLGYAQFPTVPGGLIPISDMYNNGGTANKDGVVIDYRYIGDLGNASPPYDKGRTLTHETGHWLGLWHIWGDDGAGCTGTDYVSDTPNQADENYTCPPINGGISADACSGTTGAMYQNYMDYSDDRCLVMFTQGQKARMQAVMANCVRRNSLNSSTVCTAVGIQEGSFDIQLNICPNPTDGELSIEAKTLGIQDFIISVTNILGQTINETMHRQSNGGVFKIDLFGESGGMYFVTMKSKSGSITKRIVLK